MNVFVGPAVGLVLPVFANCLTTSYTSYGSVLDHHSSVASDFAAVAAAEHVAMHPGVAL